MRARLAPWSVPGMLALALTATVASAVVPSKKLSQSPAAFSLLSEDVVVKAARDSVPLDGWWLAGPKGAPVIVMAGGGTGNRADLLPLARALHDRGFTLLLFDYRDFGPQGPGAQDSLRDVLLASRWVDDTEGALRYARARADSGAHVFGWGTDLGSVAMLAAASRDRARPLAAGLVIDNPYRTLDEQMRWNGTAVIPDAVSRQHELLRPVDEPFTVVPRLRAPILLTLAGKDDGVPLAASEGMFRSAKVRVDRWVAPDATRATLPGAPGYLDRVTQWIQYTSKWTLPR